MYARLGVFSGGWTSEAAEAVVVGNGLPQDDVLPGLLRLVDRSLVMLERDSVGAARYRMPELADYDERSLRA